MPFTWTFSKLDNFETCARKYNAYSVARTVKDDSTENIDWGNEVHDALRDAIKGVKPLPDHMKPYQIWVDRVLAGPGDLLVENKYALDQMLSPCPYRAPVVWYRGIVDVARIDGPVGLAMDWKTGKRKEGSIQLGLMALCLFQHYPALRVVRTEYVWLQENPNYPDATTTKVFLRADMQTLVAEILPRVQKLHWAHEKGIWEPKPGGLCISYCKEITCPFHGKGAPR